MQEIQVHHAGTLINLPDVPAVYIMVCSFMGATHHRLGDILYIGVTNSVRRRVAYALGAPGEGRSAPHGAKDFLFEFQRVGGTASLLYCPLTEDAPNVDLRRLEAVLLREFLRRKGSLPAWNRAVSKSGDRPEEVRTVSAVLDQLNVVSTLRPIGETGCASVSI